MSDQTKPWQPLRPLLPAPKATQPPATRQLSASSRKRLPSTKVACNACRSKKKACDGKRPTCTPCAELNTSCVFISANEKETPAMALKRENQMLREMLSRLTAMPEDVAHQTLKKLHFALDPCAALRAMRPSGPKDAREVLPHVFSNVEFELARRHPIAYPQTRKLTISRIETSDGSRPRPAKIPRTVDSPEELPFPDDGNTAADPFIADIVGDNSSDEWKEPSRTYNTAFFVPPIGPTPPPSPTRRDPRFKDLNIAFWTVVPITNEVAAEVITLYLETDHPVLGLFDADLFLDDLVCNEVRYCSSLLVNALLAFACQAYAAKHPEASCWSQQLEDEANKLRLVQTDDTLPTFTALGFLIQSCGCNGDGKMNVRYIEEAVAMAKRMKLFGCPDTCSFVDLCRISEIKARATVRAAWGVFNTLSMVAQFYLPATMEYPPTLPIPGRHRPLDLEVKAEPTQSSNENSASNSSDSEAWAGPHRRTKRGRPMPVSETFAAFCDLWVISSQITWMYQHDTSPGSSSQAFALEKFSKLLSWADNLSDGMERGDHSPAHVLVCHMWFHSTILYLFRPFIPSEQQHGFKSWSPSAAQIPAFFAASVEQLKELVEVYASYPQATFSIFWHTALMNLANALVTDTTNPEWRPYFLGCIRAYQGLYSSFSVAEVIAVGLLSMVVSKGAMDMTEAIALVHELRAKKSQKPTTRATGKFVADLNLAVTDREAARVDRMMDKFEEMSLLDQFTHGLV